MFDNNKQTKNGRARPRHGRRSAVLQFRFDRAGHVENTIKVESTQAYPYVSTTMWRAARARGRGTVTRTPHNTRIPSHPTLSTPTPRDEEHVALRTAGCHRRRGLDGAVLSPRRAARAGCRPLDRYDESVALKRLLEALFVLLLLGVYMEECVALRCAAPCG